MNTSDGVRVTLGGGIQSLALRLYGIPHLGARLRFRRIRAALGDRRFSRGVEIGCGAGLIACALAERARVIAGFDLDQERIATAARLAPLAGPGRLRVFRGDALRVPLRSASCDLAVCSEVIEHIRDDDAAVREARRVLEPGGLFILTSTADEPWNVEAEKEFDHARAGYSGEAFRALVESNGFRVRSLEGYGVSPVSRAAWKFHRAATRRSPWLGAGFFLDAFLVSIAADAFARRKARAATVMPPALGWICAAEAV
jgi:SAM-dependent methyltransferase